MQLIDGKKISEKIFENIKQEINSLSFGPVFCDILVGNDFASKKYVSLKKKKALELGIDFHDACFEENITTEELVKEIEKINNIPNISGIILQLPLPLHIDKTKVLNAISPELDVDCLGQIASKNFYNGNLEIAPPTANACFMLLESLNLDLNNKKIVIAGEGDLVGKPFANILKYKNISFDIVNSETLNKEEIIKNADILITGIGKGKMINKDMIKEGVVIIDAGASEEDGALVGDVDFDSVKEKASFITPVIGGVGPMTIANLFLNILKVIKMKHYESR